MKLPNGYGSISKLSGNRRKPYIVRKHIGNSKYLIIGYYPTKEDALSALVEYNNAKHSTHDCRHTVASLLDRYGANPTATRSILGHKNGDVTIRVYTHKTISELRKAINLLP